MSDSELCLREIGKEIMDRRKRRTPLKKTSVEKGSLQVCFYAESGKRAMRPENLLKISSA